MTSAIRRFKDVIASPLQGETEERAYGFLIINDEEGGHGRGLAGRRISGEGRRTRGGVDFRAGPLGIATRTSVTLADCGSIFREAS
jgi:hypothetical protein